MTRAAVRLVVAVAASMVAGCLRTTTQFERYLYDRKWSDAAREFSTDSSLRANERTLYQAALLYGTPGRDPYDPAKSRELFAALLTNFPGNPHSDDAAAHLAMIDASARNQQEATKRERDLEARIAQLLRETHDLKARADSAIAASDSLRPMITRLEAERKDRDEQLRLLRAELQKLKEIDLKPRTPIKP